MCWKHKTWVEKKTCVKCGAKLKKVASVPYERRKDTQFVGHLIKTSKARWIRIEDGPITVALQCLNCGTVTGFKDFNDWVAPDYLELVETYICVSLYAQHLKEVSDVIQSQ